MTMRPLFYDTETTGLYPETDRIIEIAVYDPVNERTFCEFVNPGIPISPQASAINHITDDMIAASGSFAEVGKRFIEFCDGDVVLIAHNNDRFDIHFLNNECKRHGLTMPSSWKFLDSLRWARKYRPDLTSHSLQYLRDVYGISENTAHRALDDVYILYQVFCAMVQDLPIDAVYSLMQR